MNFLTVQEAMNKGKGEVSLRGWVYRERKSNNLIFIVLRDATNIMQCVIKKEGVDKKIWEAAEKILVESSVKVIGEIKEDKRAPTGYELNVKNFEVVHYAEPFPITKDQSPEFLLDKRHLWIRSRKMVAIMKVRATVLRAFREFYNKQGYFEFSTPVLQPTQSEGGSTLFEVKYYDDKTFLAQTWQLYGEAGIFALEKIYTIGPCFRAEKSKTSRHLSEFWMAEMEAAWMELPELLDSIEACIEFLVKKVLENNMEDLKILGRDPKDLEKVKRPFARMTYDDVLKLLEEEDGIKIGWGKDLRTIEEDKLSSHFDKPVIVTNYPKEIMAFYKPEDPNKPGTALCVDVIAPEGYGEIVGGSQRDLDISKMAELLRRDGEDPKNYEYYFDTRRFGSVPHSGYGLGVERVVSWICRLDNIKDAIPFPRTMMRKTP